MRLGRSDAIIVTPNAPRALRRYYSNSKCIPGPTVRISLCSLPQGVPPKTKYPTIFDIFFAYV